MAPLFAQEMIELRITVEACQPMTSSGGLRVSETLILKPSSFIDLCKILGQFHDLAENIRKDEP